MKVIIAGGRNFTQTELIEISVLKSGFKITELVCGGADGIDRLAWKWAVKKHIPVNLFKANWDKFGKYAGPKRNKEMAEYADALILIWDGKSKGSASMKKEAIINKIKMYEVVV